MFAPASASTPRPRSTIPPVERTSIRVNCSTEIASSSPAARNTGPGPSQASTGPATGPIAREPNCIIEASVIALSSAVLPTVFGSSAACAGISAERKMPDSSVISTRLHSSITSRKASSASSSASTIAPLRATCTTRARS